MLHLAGVYVYELEEHVAVTVRDDEHDLGGESRYVGHERTAAYALGQVEFLYSGCSLAFGRGAV